uniref:Kinesin-like protein KIF13A isoform X4 n=1 Tax=Petromyzon marinus TaxID=7757 RepID=A0AAJ7T247_PETMA|nr:kinesin-like protein KIF13A isoform X4 [Petromyzon marinus]
MPDAKVTVAVRVRPMSKRERDLNTRCVVDMDDNQTVLYPPDSGGSGGGVKADGRKQPKVFAFDHCFWSMDERNKGKYAGQEVVFHALGDGILDNAFQGYNACIFAYGQTGSGKSYSMMGSAEQPGLTPRLCGALFERVSRLSRDDHSFKVEVSYMEIYNEKVRDLLDPKGGRQSLKVREHKLLGPYVDGLSQLAVRTFQDIDSLMSEGNKSRTVAATNMNEESSRSHAVFTITLTQTLTDLASGTSGEKVSRLSLVDLAGSERASKTGAAGDRLKEGSNINKSLSTLGLVISALADQAAGKNKNKFVPYRDSALTWLLKDNLGGNSRTAMVATVSPAADNYEETLSTLRYADRAKRIVNHAVVNEDPNARIIRELRDEVDKLRSQLNQAESLMAPELQERLQQSEKLIQEMTLTWEQKLRKTEEIAQERQKQLESMGISLESSGIKVGEDKCFLVNLNADPALNELLVYYLKERTAVGAADSQDVQLCGIGILPEHCTITMAPDGDIALQPFQGARTCVNGAVVTSATPLWHGDRILWGNNHFFRINLPGHKRRTRVRDGGGADAPEASDWESGSVGGSPGSEVSSEYDCSFEFARTEVMMKALGSDDPVASLLGSLERQHEQEKRSALQRQRELYERQLDSLRQQLPPESLSPSRAPASGARAALLSPPTPGTSNRLRQWAEERDQVFRLSLARLREQVVRTDALVREANFLASEMGRNTEYQVTLQIPAHNLSANRKRGGMVSEAAVQVRREGRGTQVWGVEKLENKLVDMRELYQAWREQHPAEGAGWGRQADPFFEAQENQKLIGVANVFLECLYHDVTLQYAAPIISQQGEVAGRLHVELERVGGAVPDRFGGGEEGGSENSSESGVCDECEGDGSPPRRLICRVKIREATGLPPALTNFVFCQYWLWDHPEATVVPPALGPDSRSPSSPTVPSAPSCSVKFGHCKEFVVNVTEDFLEFMMDGALSVEVWGHMHGGAAGSRPPWEFTTLQAKTRSLRDRWGEVTRKLELWVEIQELNEEGEYSPVEVTQARDVHTGGVYQLRQGQSRRVQVSVRGVQQSGTLPIVPEEVLSIAVGGITARCSRLQRPLDSYQSEEGDPKELDSYQEEDLSYLRERWTEALMKRKEYMGAQMRRVINKPDKCAGDEEREVRLVDQWVSLTEERNAVLVPAPGSGIPGAPADWTPPPGMEKHIPVLFLDLNAEDLSSQELLTGRYAAGTNSILPKELGSPFYCLPIVRHSDSQVCAVASWDSSLHDSPHLNKITAATERIYLIAKATVQLSHPAAMEMVLRKRVCVCVYNKQSFTQSLKRRMSSRSSQRSTGVTYEIVSNIPTASEEPEERETLALMAARGGEGASAGEEGDEEPWGGGDGYMETYARGVLGVESILGLDRLRQEVVVRESLAAKGRPSRRSSSSSNMQRLSSGSRMDLSGGCEEEEDDSKLQLHWDSFQDISRAARGHDPPATAAPSFDSAPPTEPPPPAPRPPAPPPPRLMKALMPTRQLRLSERPREARPLLGPQLRDSSESEEEEEEENELGPAATIATSGAAASPAPPPSTPPPGGGGGGEFSEFVGFSAGGGSGAAAFDVAALGGPAAGPPAAVTRSPTASSLSSSGYFSHSTSSATLCDSAAGAPELAGSEVADPRREATEASRDKRGDDDDDGGGGHCSRSSREDCLPAVPEAGTEGSCACDANGRPAPCRAAGEQQQERCDHHHQRRQQRDDGARRGSKDGKNSVGDRDDTDAESDVEDCSDHGEGAERTEPRGEGPPREGPPREGPPLGQGTEGKEQGDEECAAATPPPSPVARLPSPPPAPRVHKRAPPAPAAAAANPRSRRGAARPPGTRARGAARPAPRQRRGEIRWTSGGRRRRRRRYPAVAGHLSSRAGCPPSLRRERVEEEYYQIIKRGSPGLKEPQRFSVTPQCYQECSYAAQAEGAGGGVGNAFYYTVYHAFYYMCFTLRFTTLTKLKLFNNGGLVALPARPQPALPRVHVP